MEIDKNKLKDFIYHAKKVINLHEEKELTECYGHLCSLCPLSSRNNGVGCNCPSYVRLFYSGNNRLEALKKWLQNYEVKEILKNKLGSV